MMPGSTRANQGRRTSRGRHDPNGQRDRRKRPDRRVGSELEVDELLAAELAPEHDGVEAGRVEDAADVPGVRAITSRSSARYWINWTSRSGMIDDERPGAGRPPPGSPAGARSPRACRRPARPTRRGRAASRGRPGGTSTTIRRPFQQARSTGSAGSIRSSQGSARRCADQEQPLVDAPEDEGPGRAMPEAAEDHRQHQVAVGPQRAAAAAAQRDVEVVAQPVREADVPAAPEVPGAGREVRQVEVERAARSPGTWRRPARCRCSPRSRRRSGRRRHRSPAGPEPPSSVCQRPNRSLTIAARLSATTTFLSRPQKIRYAPS